MYMQKLELLYVIRYPIALWPPVEFGKIYIYIPRQFTREKMKAYNSLDAFNIKGKYFALYIHFMSFVFNKHLFQAVLYYDLKLQIKSLCKKGFPA